jgi:hypothetical protein
MKTFRHSKLLCAEDSRSVSGNIESHFHRTAAMGEATFVAQVSHEEKPPSPTTLEQVGTCWIGHLTGIKTQSFIADRYRQGTFLASERDGNIFALVTAVAM